VLVQVEIWNNLCTVTVPSSFWGKFAELPEHVAMVLFIDGYK